MNTVADNLLSVIRGHEMSYGELSRLTGIPKSALQRYATGRTRKIPFDRVRLIAEVIGVDPAVLTGDTNAPARTDIPLAGSKTRIPLIKSTGIGKAPILSAENILRMTEQPDNMDADFCFYCRGGGMPDARIQSGDLVFICCRQDADSGQPAAVVIGDTLTLKRIYRYPKRNRLILQAGDAAEPLIFEGEAIENVRVIGIAVGVSAVL